MSWKTDLAKSVSKIDKATGISQKSLDILIDDFQEHKDIERDWQANIVEDIKSCPETSHIKLQNGKLDRLNEKLDKMWKRLWIGVVAVIGFACTVIGGIAAWKELYG